MNILQRDINIRNCNIFNKERVKVENIEKNISPYYYKKENIQYKSFFGIIELFSPKKYL